VFSKPIQFIAQRPTLFAVMIIAACVVSVSALAAVPKPEIPKGKGDRCVEDTGFMRKNHMELLLHQRDETVHRGIRTKKHSLKECIDCHAVNDNQGQPVSHEDSKHFCVVCHEYASVKIDCFECHASKPRVKKAGQRL